MAIIVSCQTVFNFFVYDGQRIIQKIKHPVDILSPESRDVPIMYDRSYIPTKHYKYFRVAHKLTFLLTKASDSERTFPRPRTALCTAELVAAAHPVQKLMIDAKQRGQQGAFIF